MIRIPAPYLFLLLLLTSCHSPSSTPGNHTAPAGEPVLPVIPDGWVSDNERLYTREQVIWLDSLLATHEKETGNEIAVVTWAPEKDSNLSEPAFDSLSLQLFRKWGVGKKENNNGVGLLLSSRLRRIRIEVGLGLEQQLTNAECRHIIDSIALPYLKQGDYFQATRASVAAIIREIQ